MSTAEIENMSVSNLTSSVTLGDGGYNFLPFKVNISNLMRYEDENETILQLKIAYQRASEIHKTDFL